MFWLARCDLGEMSFYFVHDAELHKPARTHPEMDERAGGDTPISPSNMRSDLRR